MSTRKPLLLSLTGLKSVTGRKPQETRDYNGAAVVNADGKEIPLTSEMIDRVLLQAQEFLSPATLKPTYKACRA